MTLSMLWLILFYIFMGSLVLSLVLVIFSCFKKVLTGPAEQQDIEKTETEATHQTRFMAEIALNKEMRPLSRMSV
jgi:hypothetical protein